MGTRREQQGMSHVPQLGLCTNVLQPVNKWFQGQGRGTWGVCLTFTPRNVTQVVGFYSLEWKEEVSSAAPKISNYSYAIHTHLVQDKEMWEGER